MKRVLFGIIIFTIVGCGSYPMTSFYVKNTTDKTINFDATVIKPSQISGPIRFNQSFTVKPMDSVLTRRIGFKSNGLNPQNWFINFFISPIEGIEFNNPKSPEMWKKSLDRNGKPTYTFTLNK